jgi:hypothetical protein
MHGYGEMVQGGKEEEEREEFNTEVAEGPQRKRRIMGDEEREGRIGLEICARYQRGRRGGARGFALAGLQDAGATR